jgi:hypothetical protein
VRCRRVLLLRHYSKAFLSFDIPVVVCNKIVDVWSLNTGPKVVVIDICCFQVRPLNQLPCFRLLTLGKFPKKSNSAVKSLFEDLNIPVSGILVMSTSSSSSPEDKVDGLGGLLTLVGIVPARARFIGGAVASSLLSSLTIGLSFGMMGAAFISTGPLIPFLVGSWIGHSFGLYHYYRSSKNDAIKLARNFPSLLAHAMWTEFGVIVPPAVVEATDEWCRRYNGKVDGETPTSGTAAAIQGSGSGIMTMDQWIQHKGYKMVGFAILSVPQCTEDVEEILRRERESLIQAHQDKMTSSEKEYR